MSDNPSLAIAIPCFNAGHYLPFLLDSITLQTHPPDEVIVVDDGSTDNLRQIVSRYGWTTFVSHERNRGIGFSRNTALQRASSDIILFVDADAILHPDLLRILVSGYTNDQIAGIGGCGIERIQLSRSDRWRAAFLFQTWGSRTISNVPFLFGLVCSYRRKILQKLGGFDPFFKGSGEDVDMGYRIQKAGYHLSYIPNAIVFHIRKDNPRSIRNMTYRHMYWGFLAQLKNGCFTNKVSLAENIRIFFRQVYQKGLFKRDFSYCYLSLTLYAVILKALFKAVCTARHIWTKESVKLIHSRLGIQ